MRKNYLVYTGCRHKITYKKTMYYKQNHRESMKSKIEDILFGLEKERVQQTMEVSTSSKVC